MVSYHVQYQKKTNDLILRKLSDGQMDGQMGWQTEGWMDKSNFIGGCPTNIVHLTYSFQQEE